MERRKCQVRAIGETTAAIEAGERKICVTSPTGSGKTIMFIDLIEWAAAKGWRTALYTNRRLLCAQLKGVLESHGICPGVRAAGFEPDFTKPVQLCMTQTEDSKINRKQNRDIHSAHLVIIDEAHIQKGNAIQDFIALHRDQEAVIVGYTATPLDLGGIYDKLIVAGTMDECFEEGSLVRARHFGPSEPDLRHIRSYNVGMDPTERENVKAIMRPGIFGEVYTHWGRLNPNSEPTILFGPDVAGSVYFAEEFHKAGIRAAHIDGANVWLDGRWIGSDNADARDYVINLVRSGDVPVICNRFVLREGIDLPELRHGILATVFGAMTSYLQSCGRLLRAADGKDHATIQDHGGNWHRLGSVNSTRTWDMDSTNCQIVGERQQDIRDKKEPEPICCPRCHGLRLSGSKCPFCGYEYNDRSRIVIQTDGNLVALHGNIYPERKTKMKPNTEETWNRYYYSQRRAGRTFGQAYGWFRHQEGYWPPKDLPLMPKKRAHWFWRIDLVPQEGLITSRESTQVVTQQALTTIPANGEPAQQSTQVVTQQGLTTIPTATTTGQST